MAENETPPGAHPEQALEPHGDQPKVGRNRILRPTRKPSIVETPSPRGTSTQKPAGNPRSGEEMEEMRKLKEEEDKKYS